MSLDSFAGKSVFITGGAGGIGLALAEAFLSEGARVFIADIDEDKVISTMQRLSREDSICRGKACDVAQVESVDSVFRYAWDKMGGIDILCNNAGVVLRGSLLDAPLEDIEWQFSVNVFGALNVNRAYVNYLRQSGRAGYILITGSEHSLSNPDYTLEARVHAYTMTKHSVLAMADILRRELAPDNIQVSLLCPGAVATDIGKNSERNAHGKESQKLSGEQLAMSEEALDTIVARTIEPGEAAKTALEGIRHGMFFIPTHAHTRHDVECRYQHIMAGFDLIP